MLTKRDLFLAMRARALAEPGNKFSREAIDTEGTDINLVFNAFAALGEELSLEGQRQDNARYLSTAPSVSDEAVERVGFELTSGQVLRKTDLAAVVTLTFERSNTHALTIGKDYVVSTNETGVPFRLIDDVSWPLGDKTAKTVKAVCESSGTSGNVDAGTITVLSEDVGDDSVTVTNAAPGAGGREQETIVDYMRRVRSWFENQARGTLSAIEFGAEQVGEVAQATAVEIVTPEDEIPIYRAKVSIADVNGQANPALVDLVREKLQEYRCAGVPVLVVGVTHQQITVRWTGLKAKAGFTLATLLEDLFSRCISRVAELGPEETLERAMLFAVAKAVEGLQVPAGSLIEPLDDIVPNPGYTLRLRREAISHV
jgi:hypothetical protein